MSPSTGAPPPRLLTVAQAAEHLDTTTSRLYELAAAHAIPSVRIGRAIRIPQDALDPPAPRPDEPEVRTSAAARTSHLQSTSDAVPMPERHHREQQASEPRQPNSREAPSAATDLHPRATRRRVDAESPRQARS